MMKKLLSLLFLALLAMTAEAQTFSGKVVDAENKPLEAASVVVTGEGNKTLAFGYSKADGSFSLTAKDGATAINFSMMGFERLTIAAEDFKNGQSIMLAAKDFVLKEVKVRPDKITQAEDTLNYSVAMFQRGQDRSIADVIKNMPGMEVSANGQISFEGKPINKFYIEGMDLMGSKYSQASENLQAKKVKTVQVVQNHQPIKSLRGVQFSDQAAINLVLKEDAKNAWAGTADVGLGAPLNPPSRGDFPAANLAAADGNLKAPSPSGEGRGGAVLPLEGGVRGGLLYDWRLMAMMFSKKHQNLSMYKANNSGKDIVHEIADLASLLRSRQEMSGLLSNITVSAPDLDEQRTNFNTSHTVATNELIRTRHGNDFRIQADWLWNRQRGNVYSETEYTDLGGILLSEETSVSAINNRLKADLTYKINKDKVYLNNRLHGYMNFDRSFGSTILNGSETRQSVRPRKRYLTEDFETLRTLRNGNVLNFSSQTTYSELPGQLLTVLGETERLNLSGIESQNTLSFRQRIRAFTIKYEAGFSFKNQKMRVAPLNPPSEEDFPAEDGGTECAASASPSLTPYASVGIDQREGNLSCDLAHDSFSFNQQNIFLTPSVNFERGSWKMNVSMKADLMLASSLRSPRLTLQPRLNLKYNLSGTTALQTTYLYSETANALTSLVSTPVFTSYRTKTCYSGKFEPTSLHSASLALNYKQPVRGNFLTLEGSWQKRTNNILYQSQLTDNVYLRTPTDHRYAADTYSLRAHASKSLYWAKTSVSLTATQSWSDYCLLAPLNPPSRGDFPAANLAAADGNLKSPSRGGFPAANFTAADGNLKAPSPSGEGWGGAVTDWQMETFALAFRLTMTPTRIFSYELRSKLNSSKQKQLSKNSPSPSGEGRGGALTYFNHSLDLYFFPTQKWEISVKNTLYHSNDKTVSLTHFADAHISYKQKRYELRLAANNLIGTDKFERRTIGTTANLYTIYKLRPREILLSISLDL